jgi:FkbM family methyltransferase
MKNYIQIGANTGCTHKKENDSYECDEFYHICEKITEPSNIFLIEPNKILLSKLMEYYSKLNNKNLKIKIFNIGIVGDNTKNTNTLYVYGDDNNENILYGLSSIIRRKSWNKVLDTIPFIPKTFNDFCSENNIVDVEVLFVDTEGMDYEILNSIDLNKINIKNIYFEYWPYTNDDLDNKILINDSILKKIFEKYNNYTITEIYLGGMKSYFMNKKNESLLSTADLDMRDRFLS